MEFKSRYVYAILILLFISANTFAQLSSIGVKGGLNLSKLDYKSDLKGYDFSFRNGINAGIFCEYNLTRSILFRTELFYSMRGTEYGAEARTVDGIRIPNHKFIQKHNYLEIPLLIQYNFTTDFIVKPKVFIGPEFSFLLNAKIEYTEEGNSKTEVDDKNHIKSNEYGIVIGAGAECESQSGKIIFDLRYNYGLKNINILKEGSEIKSNTISFNLGYAFSL